MTPFTAIIDDRVVLNTKQYFNYYDIKKLIKLL